MIDLSFFVKTLLILEKNVNFVNVFPIINEYKQRMKNYFSLLFLVAMLLGTSSFTYETAATNSTEYVSIKKHKKHKSRRTRQRAKTHKLENRRRGYTRSANVGQTVYITPTGSCYHSRTSCPALWRGHYSRISLSSAQNEGYRACSRCY